MVSVFLYHKKAFDIVNLHKKYMQTVSEVTSYSGLKVIYIIEDSMYLLIITNLN